MITNMGPLNDTYQIKLEDPPREAGWDWFFYDSRERERSVTLTSPHIRDLVGGRSFKAFRVMVQCPIDAWRDEVFRVSAISENLFSDVRAEVYEDSDEMILMAGHSSGGFYPRISPSIYYVDPGEWIKISIPLTNLGNKDVIDIDLKILEDNFFFASPRYFEEIYVPNYYLLDFNWTERNVKVYQGQTLYQEVMVRTNPLWSGEDHIFQFKIYASIRGYSYWVLSNTVTLIVNKYTTLKAQVNRGEDINITPEEEKHVNLSISNSGWSEDVIKDIYLLEPDGVKLTSYNRTGNISYRFDVHGEYTFDEDGEFTTLIDLGFKLERFFNPGEITRQLFIRPMYDDPIILNITLNILEKIELKILPLDTYFSDIVQIGPGEEKTVTFGVRNEGNSVRTLTMDIWRAVMREGELKITSHSDGWSASMEWISQVKEPSYMFKIDLENLPLNPSDIMEDAGYLISEEMAVYEIPIVIESGETVWVGYRIRNPGADDSNLIPPYPMKVFIYSETKMILAERDLVMEVKYPDLDFTDALSLTDEFGNGLINVKSGQRIFFKVNVTNKGDWYSNRTLVTLIANDEVIDRLWIMPLLPGQNTVLKGNFTVDRNYDGIELVIDPNNDLIELDDQYMEGSEPNANTVRAPLSVKENNNNSALVISIILFLTLAVILAGISAFIYFRMRKSYPAAENR